MNFLDGVISSLTVNHELEVTLRWISEEISEYCTIILSANGELIGQNIIGNCYEFTGYSFIGCRTYDFNVAVATQSGRISDGESIIYERRMLFYLILWNISNHSVTVASIHSISTSFDGEDLHIEWTMQGEEDECIYNILINEEFEGSTLEHYYIITNRSFIPCKTYDIKVTPMLPSGSSVITGRRISFERGVLENFHKLLLSLKILLSKCVLKNNLVMNHNI